MNCFYGSFYFPFSASKMINNIKSYIDIPIKVSGDHAKLIKNN